jgi:hypothetical protein
MMKLNNRSQTMSEAKDFEGLTKKGAQNKAEAENLIFRLIKVDGAEFLAYPEDTRTDRICIEIEGGKVVKATIQ